MRFLCSIRVSRTLEGTNFWLRYMVLVACLGSLLSGRPSLPMANGSALW